jgi:uncharacterized protein with PIN domain
MVIDSSALMSIPRNEPERAAFQRAIDAIKYALSRR